MGLDNKKRARVRIFSHPAVHSRRDGPSFDPAIGYTPGDVIEDGSIVSEFVTEGGMHLSGGPSGDGPREPEGACLFGLMVDYAGLNSAFPRARYSHLILMDAFNWDTRRGAYIHIPYGGRIEIEAL